MDTIGEKKTIFNIHVQTPMGQHFFNSHFPIWKLWPLTQKKSRISNSLPLSSQINWACDGREDKTQELFIKITVIPGLHTTFITHYI